MKCLLLMVFILHSTCCSASSLQPFNPSLPLFGSGPVTNLSSAESYTNASAHIAWALAIPLLGEHYGGHKGKLYAGLSWIAFSIITESFFHAPQHTSDGYPSEVRTDLITKLVPTLLVLSF